MYEIKMYFGLSCPLPSRTVSVGNRAFCAFVQDEIIPRFPDGFTILDGMGTWKRKGSSEIIRENCKILVLIVKSWENADIQGKVYDIRNRYCELYKQESVLITASGLCEASF